MESLYLKTLVEVVKTGSLSRAAEALCVTQPAVSRRIKFLEDQYGCELLDRSGPKLRPTEAGQLVFRKAEALLEIEAEILTNLRDMGGKTRISFGGSAAFGIAHLPAVLREFMLDCGDRAEVSCAVRTPEQLLDALADGQFDLAVVEMCDGLDLSAWRVFPLPDDELTFVAAPWLGVPHPETTVEALLDIPLYTRKDGCCSRTLLEANLRRVGHEIADFKKTIVLDDLHAVVDAVLNGEGVSFISRDVLAESFATGLLRQHRVPGFRHSRSRALVLRSVEAPGGPLRRFLAKVLARFSLPLPADLAVSTETAGEGEGCGCARPRETESACVLPAARRSRA